MKNQDEWETLKNLAINDNMYSRDRDLSLTRTDTLTVFPYYISRDFCKEKSMHTEEIWKSIKGYENIYEISNYGRLRKILRYIGSSTNPTKNILIATPCKDAKGYLRYRLVFNKKGRTIKIHREVANAFIPNHENKPQINHKDGNKQNNHVDNLEWVTNKENVNHAKCLGLRKNVDDSTKKYYKITFPDGHEEIVFGLAGFCRNYGLSIDSMSMISRGLQHQHKGFRCEKIQTTER